jgi:cytochrome oxidase Cu insertion factor (SCO1/SenC/PrrC family)
MSDSHSTDESSPRDEARTSASGPPAALRWFFVLNGLFCVVLIGAWIALGMRGRGSSESGDSGTSKPFASATDTVEDDDDDGRPKVIQIVMKWPESGIADFEFTERSGKTVRKADLVGHPWIVSFIFTHCAGPCFRVTSAMKRLQEEFLGDTDLRLVTLTVDPERDTPAQLTKYANGFGASPDRWFFLTDPSGQKDKLYPLINGSFLMPVQEATGEMRAEGFEFIHTNNILLVDERGVVQGKWLSTDDASFDQLRRELRKRYKQPAKEDTAPDEGSPKSE